LQASPAYFEGIGLTPSPPISLAYGQSAQASGFHIMEAPSTHWVETLSGLGATGVDLVLTHVDGLPQQAHPFIPVIQVSTAETGRPLASMDFDLLLHGEVSQWAEQLLGLAVTVAAHQYVPKSVVQGNLDFQITRGLLGVTV
jgi:altronate dehydratase